MDDPHFSHHSMDKQVKLAEVKHPPTECVDWDMPAYRGSKRNYVSVRAVYWTDSFAS